MFPDIYCVMVNGVSLSPATRTELVRTACLIARAETNESNFQCDDACGRIWTEYHSARLGSYTGLLFEAEVLTEQGIGRVAYIVRTQDLERIDDWHRHGLWGDQIKARLEQVAINN